MMHHRLTIGGELNIAFDAEIARYRGLRCARHILDDAAGAVRAAAMGHRPRRQPVGRAHLTVRLRDLEDSLDLDRGIGWKRGDADGGAGMAALVAEGPRPSGRKRRSALSVRPENSGGGIDEAAQAGHADHLIEIAHRGLDLCQQVDGTPAGPALPCLHADPGGRAYPWRSACRPD